MSVIRTLLKSNDGNVLAMVAIGLPVLIGIAALAIDVPQWETTKLNGQVVADQAALSALVAYQANSNPDDITKRDWAVKEGFSVADYYGFGASNVNQTVAIHNPPLTGKYVGDPHAFEVITTQKTSNLFSVLFAREAPTLTARAVAVSSSKSNACIIALDPSPTPNVTGIIGAGKGALNASGGGDVTTVNCDIYVNSSSALAIHVTGGGSIRAPNISVVGRYAGQVVTTEASEPKVGAAAVADPYALRSVPQWDSCDSQTVWTGQVSNLTGVRAFCQDVKVTGETYLAPGIYIIVNGSLQSSKPIHGEDVTIILTSDDPFKRNGVFSFTSGATLNLTAPTSGPTAGIALWADKNLAHNADNFKAGTTGNITGAIYLPSHLVNYSGSATTGSTCTQLIAAQIAVSGGANFGHDCNGLGVEGVGTGSAFRRGVLAE